PVDQLEATLVVLRLISDIPRSYFAQVSPGAPRVDEQQPAASDPLTDVLDLLVLLNQQTRFRPVVMTLVNELVQRRTATRVSLGWLLGEGVRLQAISHLEKFDRKTASLQRLESVMEECLDQDEEIVWPHEGSGPVLREHGEYGRAEGVAHVVSLPL